MTYPAGHREEVRRRVVASARELFNQRGYDGVTIDAVMHNAALTRGAFYFHFNSKAELYRESIAHVLVEHPSARWMAAGDMRPLRDRIIDAYLGSDHLERVQESCPLVTQAAETARQGDEAQAVFRSVLNALLTALGGSAEEDRGTGLALACLCVGGVSLARGVGDPELGQAILDAARKAAGMIEAGTAASDLGGALRTPGSGKHPR